MELLDKHHYVNLGTRPTKCVGLVASQSVATTRGHISAGNLMAGDEVFAGDGQRATVAAVSVGRVESFQISSSDGFDTFVPATLRLAVDLRTGNDRAWTPANVAMDELLQSDLRRGAARTEWRWRLPVPAPLDMEPKSFTIDPYVLGSAIANGSTTGCSVTISTPDPEVIARLEAAGGHLVANNTGACQRVLMRGAIGAIRDMGIDVSSHEKFIPSSYVLGSIDQRIDLLHGLLDGDGTGSAKKRKCVRYSTTSEQLARDVAHLVRTLGGTGSVATSDRRHHGKPIEYTVTIMLPAHIDPFFTTRKKRGSTTNRTGPHRTLTSVLPVGELGGVTITIGGEGVLLGDGLLAGWATSE